jgi:hexosaminidase
MLKGARAGAQDLPASVNLEINSSAASIAFLHTTGWSSPLTSPRTKIGSYTVQYNDGSSAVVPLEYGRSISAWTEPVLKTTVIDPVWRGRTKENLDVGLSVLVWSNPKPTLEIKQIVFASDGLQSNPTLIGLTLLEKPL